MRHLFIMFISSFTISAAAFAGPVADAAKKGDVAELERLLASGADANEPDGLASPLHWAAMNGHSDALILLVAEGANLDAQSNMLGTPLHAAARFDRVEAASELLRAGADPNARDKDEYTPLMRAVVEDRISVVETLILGGADVDAVGIAPGGQPTGRGPTLALHIALSYGRSEIVEFLQAAGAGPIPPDIPTNFLASGDTERGRELANTACRQCHLIEAGDSGHTGDRTVGPPLIGVMGRPVADLGGFNYSEALVAFGGNWTPERVYQFVLRPMLTVPGTEMNWPPELTPEEIADVTAYFASVSE
jgi:cytochrome c2